MSDQMEPQPLRATLRDAAAPWLWMVGVRAWLTLGVAALVVAIYSLLASIASIVIPLVVAVVIAMLFVPLVDMLDVRHVPRWLASLVVIALLLGVLGGVVWLVVVGIAGQGDTIANTLTRSRTQVDEWLGAFNLPDALIAEINTNITQATPGLLAGVASFFQSSFTGVIAALLGASLGIFLLFYLLNDWENVIAWLGCHMGMPPQLGTLLLNDTVLIMRRYYFALTLSSLVVTLCIALTMAVLGLPLVVTVAVVTMITSYIPYIGAIVSGVFAFLVALGSGSFVDALVVLAVVLVVQNVVQTVIQNQLASDQLQMHPLATLLATFVGGGLFGLLGATLSTPLVALLWNVQKQVREFYSGAAAEATDATHAADALASDSAGASPVAARGADG